MKTNAEKLSITLPSSLAQFIREYQAEHDRMNKSEVIQEAVKLLRKKTLEHEYMQANAEIDSDFDAILSDGLEDETW